MIPLRSNPDSPVKLVPIQALQLSSFLYHHYTSQNVYTSQIFKLDWTTINSNVYRLILSICFESGNSSRTDMKSPQQIRRSIVMPCFASFLPQTWIWAWKDIYLHIFANILGKRREVQLKCGPRKGYFNGMHTSRKKSALELAIYIYI